MKNSVRFPLRTVLIYLIVGVVWITLSDQLIGLFSADATVITSLQTFKGWFFIGASSLLLYIILLSQFKRLHKSLALQWEAEQALFDSESQLRAMFDAASVGVVLADVQEGRVLRWNRKFKEITGYADDDLDRLGFLDLAQPDVLRRNSEVFADAMRGVIPSYVDERQYVKSDGNVVSVRVIVSFLRGESGEPVSSVLIFEDISKSMETERNLAESEHRLRSLFEASVDAIVVSSMDAKVTACNRQTALMLGYSSADEVIGRSVFDFVAPEDRERMYEKTAIVVEKGMLRSFEFGVVRKDGSKLTVEGSYTLMTDATGQPRGMLSILRDVTEKKILEKKYLQAQRMESVGTLAAGIAHDLNNILAPIMLALETLRKKSSDEREKRMIDLLFSSSQRGAELVKQVLTFARGTDSERSLLQPRHSIDEIRKFTRETFPANIEVQTNAPKDIWPILSNPTELHQILLNLCVNARDAMPKGGTLTIDAENVVLDRHFARMQPGAKPGDHVVIRVKDTGEGIPRSVLDRIFEPFFTTKGAGKGTGLGLSTVYSLVKDHGGFIDVTSEVGRGTQFDVYFPAARNEAAPHQAPLAESLMPGNGELILIVDDEAAVCEISKVTLEASGYTVLTARDGVEAITVYAQQTPKIKLVVTDMTMPLMDGPALVRALRKMDPTVRIIGSSGNVEKSTLAGMKEIALDDFLSKPYTAAKLVQAVSAVLSK